MPTLFTGSSSVGEARSSSSNQSIQEQSNHEAAGSSGAKTNENVYRTSRPELENPSRKFDSSENKGREIMELENDMASPFPL